MGYFKLIFLFLLFPGIVHASFDGGGDLVFAEFGNLSITDSVSLGDISQTTIFYISPYGKLKLKNYTIYGSLIISENGISFIDRLYGAVDLPNVEITLGKQYFNTGYGRIFKINNLMWSMYSPLNIYKSGGRTGISFMYYFNTNFLNIRGGMFLNPLSSSYKSFSENTYAIEEEINIDRYGFKTGQFYNFRNGRMKYLFSFSFNADIFCGLNAEFQTFSNVLEKDSFSYRGSISADYTIPLGNGFYIDAEYLYKKDRNLSVFSYIPIASFNDRETNSILAFQASYPFNLIFKSSIFGLYNTDARNYYIGGDLTVGKQIFHTDIVLGYNKYVREASLLKKADLSGGLMFRLSL